jgi:hypothetical protein
MFYYEIDYDSSDVRYSHKLTSSYFEYGVGIGYDKNKSPVFFIEQVESVLVEPGDYYNPPVYTPEPIEIIEVRPRLKFPKR